MAGDGRTREGVGERDRAGSASREARIPGFAPRGASSRPLRLSWIVILGSLAGLPPLAIDLYLPAPPSLTHGLHASASTGQLTLTGFVAGLAAGQLVAGALSDAHGRRAPTRMLRLSAGTERPLQKGNGGRDDTTPAPAAR